MANIKRISLLGFLIMLAAVLAGCGISKRPEYYYSDGDSYDMGGAIIDGEIRELDINWYNGNVEIAYYDGEDVKFSESSGDELDDDLALRYKIEEKKLIIKFVKSGVRMPSDFKKTLTVSLPRGKAFSSIEVETVSADINVGNITAAEAEIKTISGRVELEEMSVLGTVDLSSVSGEMHASFVSSLHGLYIDTVSGNVWANAEEVEEFEMETVSGNITADFASAPDKGTIDSVSGDVTVSLTVEGGFTLDFSTTSGQFESDFKVDESLHGRYVHGNGEKKYSAETVSGNINIKEHH